MFTWRTAGLGARVSEDNYEKPGATGRMDEEFVQFSQWCIDALAPGTYLIQEIYGHAWENLILKIASPTQWGKDFKQAVFERRLTKLRLLLEVSGNPMLSTDRQVQYEVRGG